jgi:hypothetical protein
MVIGSNLVFLHRNNLASAEDLRAFGLVPFPRTPGVCLHQAYRCKYSKVLDTSIATR